MGPQDSTVHDTAQRAAKIMAILTSDEPDQRDLVIEVLRAHGELEPIDISAADLAELHGAARELRGVFTATDTAEAAARINLLLARHAHPPRLTTHGGQSDWHLHVDGDDDAPWGEWFITSSCLALAVLLAERGVPPAGICASPSCGTPFVNTGRGTPRRYCSPGCATRERVAAHRARMREPDLLPGSIIGSGWLFGGRAARGDDRRVHRGPGGHAPGGHVRARGGSRRLTPRCGTLVA